jgi:hypothetical protein
MLGWERVSYHIAVARKVEKGSLKLKVALLAGREGDGLHLDGGQ